MRRIAVIVGTTFTLTVAALASLLLLSVPQADACTPPENLTVTGPTRGTINTEYTFTATVDPDTTTQPLTYQWLADRAKSSGGMHYKNRGLTDTWSFTWAVSGTDTIRVTAEQCDQPIETVYTFTIPVAVNDVTISGPTEAVTDTAYSFTAVVSPVTVTAPLTYTWMPAPNAGQGANTVTYTWATTGSKYIRVTAVNADGVATDTHRLTVAQPARMSVRYLPIVFGEPRGPTGEGSTNEEFVRRVITLTNEYRMAHGCPPVTLDERLMQAAQGHSEDMAHRDFYGHDAPDGTTLTDRLNAVGYGELYVRRTGENIAAGYISPEAVFDAWVNSPGHRDNILTCYYEDIGVGYYYLDPDPGDVRQRYYWTQDMGVEEYEGN